MALTGKELSENKAWLQNQGFSVEILYQDRPMAQWYKPDGSGGYVALPSKLPSDEYHFRRYKSRGWVLNPPEIVVAAPEVPKVETHFHRFAKPMGSPCAFDGCEEVRTEAFGSVETGVTMTEPEYTEEESVIAGQ